LILGGDRRRREDTEPDVGAERRAARDPHERQQREAAPEEIRHLEICGVGVVDGERRAREERGGEHARDAARQLDADPIRDDRGADSHRRTDGARHQREERDRELGRREAPGIVRASACARL